MPYANTGSVGRAKEGTINKGNPGLKEYAIMAGVIFATVLGGKIAFLSNILFVAAGVVAVIAILTFCARIEKYEKDEPFDKDEGPLNQKAVRLGAITYLIVIVLNIGFGFWMTSIFWVVACGFAIANWHHYREAYDKQFGEKENADETDTDDTGKEAAE